MPPKFTDANFPLHVRTPEAGNNVTVTGKPLDKQTRMVSQSGVTGAVGIGGCTCVCVILQEMACPAEGLEVHSSWGRQLRRGPQEEAEAALA